MDSFAFVMRASAAGVELGYMHTHRADEDARGIDGRPFYQGGADAGGIDGRPFYRGGIGALPDAGALEDAIADLDRRTKKIDAALATCAAAAGVRSTWTNFYHDYLSFSASSTDAIGHTAQMIVFPAQYAAGLADIQSKLPDYELKVNRWADAANTLCGTTIDDAPPPPPASGLDYIRGATTLALVVGGLYLAVKVLPTSR